MRIEDGKLYYNARGDLRGPMLKHDIGFFVDQHGSIYHPDGRQWDHHPESTANLVEAVNERSARKAGGPTEADPNRPYCKPDQSCCDFCCGN